MGKDGGKGSEDEGVRLLSCPPPILPAPPPPPRPSGSASGEAEVGSIEGGAVEEEKNGGFAALPPSLSEDGGAVRWFGPRLVEPKGWTELKRG